MARRPTPYIELSGPLFELDVIKRFNGAVRWGIEELANEADDIMASHIAKGGLIDTGRLLRSVDVTLVRSGDAVGYAKIMPTDVWPSPHRPTRTWIARGIRGGVKLRKQYDIFSRTATAVRRIDQGFIAERIAEVLND